MGKIDFCYSKPEKLGSTDEYNFAHCMLRQIYFQRAFGEKSYCLTDDLFSAYTFLLKKYKNLSSSDFFAWSYVQVSESVGVSCVFLGHVSSSF